MGPRMRRTAACFFVTSILISSCGRVPFRTPTITPSPALSLALTQRPTSSPTQIPTKIPTSSPTLTPTPVPFRTPVPLPPTNEPFGIVGQIGGPTQAVAVAGNIAYVGVGSRLTALDTSTADAPREIGSSQPFGSAVQGIEVIHDTAYVSAGGSGLYIIDISDPARMATIGSYDSPGYAEGVSVTDQYAYLADGPDGLRIIDIADPAHPVEVSAVYKMNYAFDVAINAGFAYLAAAGAGLLVADISDPLQPKEAGSLDSHGYAFGIALSGDTAYLADGWEGLRIVNVSSPASPREIAIYKTEGWAFDVAAASSTIYIADSFNALQILDASDPTEPAKLGSYDMLGNHVGKLAIGAGTVYIASRNTGLSILKVTDPANPVRVGSYNPMGYADAVAVSGSYAYVAAGPYGLRVVEVSDLARPREIGLYDTGNYAAAVVIEGNYAYILTYSSGKFPYGLHVVDVSNPALPTRTAFLENVSGQDIVVENGIAYIADEWGIRLVDVSNPNSPVQLSTLDFAQGDHAKATIATWGVAVSNQMAYIAHQDAGLKVVDVSDPRSPKLAAAHKSDYMDAPPAVAVGGDFLYLVDRSAIHSLDLSDPVNPSGAGAYDLPVAAERLIFANERLYVADSAAGLVVLDVSDPYKPSLAGWRRLPRYASGITVADRYIYVADGEGGLYIIEDTARAGQLVPFPLLERGNIFPVKEYNSLNQAQVTKSHHLVRAEPQLLLGTRQEESSNDKMKAAIVAPVRFQSQPKILTVTSIEDIGPGTLRWAIETANQTTGGAKIIFDPQVFPPLQPATIYPSSGLPALGSGNVTIDASNAGVILDGSQASSGMTGLDIPSDHNIIRGLQVINFTGYGIHIRGAGNIIGGDRKRGSGPLGEGNLVSGNGSAGVILDTVDAMGNRVIGNYIGTDLTGKRATGNLIVGVFIGDGASRNVVGGPTDAERNLISGNVRTEVSIFERGNQNKIIGNYIGTDASGQTKVGNAVMGVSIELGGFDNVIQANVICGSVAIADWGSWGNSIIGNFVGVDYTGMVSPSACVGSVSVGAFNRIGGTRPEERNIISGNGGPGIALSGLGTTAIVIGNYIGTDVTGTKALGTQGNGIVFYQGVQHTFIGGPSPEERNLISGNKSNGISLEGFGNDYNFITGNFIGTDASGMNALPNVDAGILIRDGEHNFIQGNLIANHEHPGVHITSGNYNRLHHNSFIDNSGTDGGNNNQWDDGSEGNYWSDYTGRDEDGNGIGNAPYLVPPNGADNYPLMQPF